MSFIGHISVCETHGIRRFLYPVSLEIPASLPGPDGVLGLITPDGRPIPLQVSPGATNPYQYCRLDFAVSLSPMQKLDLKLFISTLRETAGIDDPLQTEEGERFRSTQRRLSVEFDRRGTLHEVVYDSVPHLRAPAVFTRNGRRAALAGAAAFAAGFPLSARVTAAGEYPDGCGAATLLSKSL